MTHQDRKKLLELLEVRGWTRHSSHSRGTRGVRVKGRAFFDVLRAEDSRVSVLVALSPTQLGRGFEIGRSIGHGWHGRLVDELDRLADRINAPSRVNSVDIVSKEPGEEWLVLPSSLEGYIKHIRCEGARRHVLAHFLTHQGTAVTRCSEPTCIYNAPGPEDR